MKTRIILSLLAIAFWGCFARAIVTPVSVIANNTAAVATVNGGDGAFFAQQTLSESAPTIRLLYTVVLFIVLYFIWANKIKKSLTEQEK